MFFLLDLFAFPNQTNPTVAPAAPARVPVPVPPPAAAPPAWRPGETDGGASVAVDALIAATSGFGTDEEAIHAALDGKTAQEREAIRQAFAMRTGGAKLDETLEDELPSCVDEPAAAAPEPEPAAEAPPDWRETFLSSLPEEARQEVEERWAEEAAEAEEERRENEEESAEEQREYEEEAEEERLEAEEDRQEEAEEAEEDRQEAVAEAIDEGATPEQAEIAYSLSHIDDLRGKDKARAVVAALRDLPAEERSAVLAAYEAQTGDPLMDEIEELKGPDATLATMLMMSDPASQAVADTMIAAETADEEAAAQAKALHGLTPEEQEAALAGLSDEDRARTAGHLASMALEDGKREAGVKAMEEAVKGKDPQAVIDSLDRIPFEQREQALAEMSPEAREQAANAIKERATASKKAASELFKAMDGSATNEKLILDSLRGKSPAEVAEIERQYEELHPGHILRDDLEEDMDPESEEYKATDAMMRGQAAEAAMYSIVFAGDGSGTDEQIIKDTLAGLKTEAEREAFEKLWAEKKPDGFASLDAWLDDELGESASEDNLHRQEIDALRAGDQSRARAVRLYDAFEGGGTDEAAVWRELEACKDPAERQKLADEFAAVARTNGVDPELCDLGAMVADEIENKDERAVAEHLQEGELAEAYAAKLEVAASGWGTTESEFFTTFEKAPPGWKGTAEEWRQAVETAHDETYDRPLKDLAMDELSDKDNTRFAQTLESGKMDPNFAIYYATDGSGTNDDVLKGLLYKPDGSMYSKAEIEAKKQAWRESPYYDGTDLDSLVRDETSGRVGFDLEEALEGEPETAEERIERGRKRVRFENSGLLSGLVNAFTESDEAAGAQLSVAEKHYQEYEDAPPGPEKDRALARLKATDENLGINVGEHRHAMDQITDKAVSIVKAALNFIPGGQGLGQVLGSIGTQYLLKGGAVEVESAVHELGVGVVEAAFDAAINAATMGTGGVAVKGAKTAMQTVVGTVKEIAKGGLKSLASNTLTGLFDPAFLKGDKGFGEVITESTSSAAIGMLTSAGGKALGGIGDMVGGEYLGAITGGLGGKVLGKGIRAGITGQEIDAFGMGLAVAEGVGDSVQNILDARKEMAKEKHEAQVAEFDKLLEAGIDPDIAMAAATGEPGADMIDKKAVGPSLYERVGADAGPTGLKVTPLTDGRVLILNPDGTCRTKDVTDLSVEEHSSLSSADEARAGVKPEPARSPDPYHEGAEDYERAAAEEAANPWHVEKPEEAPDRSVEGLVEGYDPPDLDLDTAEAELSRFASEYGNEPEVSVGSRDESPDITATDGGGRPVRPDDLAPPPSTTPMIYAEPGSEEDERAVRQGLDEHVTPTVTATDAGGRPVAAPSSKLTVEEELEELKRQAGRK